MNFFRSILARGFVVLAGFLFLLLIAKKASPEEYGSLSLMIANGSILQLLFGFGSDASLLWHAVREGRSFSKKGFSLSVILLCIQLPLFALLSYIYAASTDRSLLSQVPDQSFAGWEVLYFSGLLLSEKLLMLFYGNGKIVVANVLLFASSLGMGILLWVMPSGWLGNFRTYYLEIYCLFVFVQTLLMLPVYLLTERPSFSMLTKADWRSLFNFSVAVFITNLLQFLAYRADYWLLYYYHGPENLAIYSQSVRFAQFSWIIPNVLASVLAAKLPGIEDRRKEKWIDNLLRNVVLYALMILPCILLVGWLLYQYYLPNAYASGWKLMIFMLPGYLFFLFAILLAALFSSNRMLFVNLKGSLLCLLLILPVDLLLIPVYAETGAAVGSLLAYGATGLYFLYEYRKWKSQAMPSLTKFELNDMRSFLRTLGDE